MLLLLCISALYFQETVYSVLILALVFMLTAFTLLLMHVEFIAYVYVIVYGGAVTLLFIFVVFMLGPVYTKRYRSDPFALFCLFIVKFLILFSTAV